MIGYIYCWQLDVTGHGPFQRMTTEYHKPLPYFTHILNPTSSTDRHICAICLVDLTEFTDTRRLARCNHQFHITCIDMWCKVYMKMTCPYCRTDISHLKNIKKKGRTYPVGRHNPSWTVFMPFYWRQSNLNQGTHHSIRATENGDLAYCKTIFIRDFISRLTNDKLVCDD